MISGKKIIVLIPARGGSKGIPKKNITPIYDKPLISFVIESAKKSKYVDEIIVSTDSDDIAAVSKQHGASVPFKRPAHLAQDISTTNIVIYHCLRFLEIQSIHYDIIIILQPTHALIQTFHIDEAIELFIKKKKNHMVGISPAVQFPVLMRYTDNDNNLTTLLPNQTTSTVRKQDMTPVYVVNGMIYVLSINSILSAPTLSINDAEIGYLIDNKYYVDVEIPPDIKQLELRLQELGLYQGKEGAERR